MKYVLVVSCASVLLLMTGCSGGKRGFPDDEYGVTPGGGRSRTVHIYMIDKTRCGVDAAVLVLRKTKKDKVRWKAEDDAAYTIHFTGDNPVQGNCLQVPKGKHGDWCDLDPSAQEKLDRYEIISDGSVCKKDGKDDPLDDPGLNVKH